MSEPWTWHCAIAFIDRWQALLAGIIGFFAAISVVWFTLRSERRKRDHELEALRRSLGVEIRQLVVAARGTHLAFKRLVQNRAAEISARTIENLGFLPEPIIYRASANKIGLLDAQAMDVVTIYLQAEIVRGGIERLLRHGSPHNIPHHLIAGVAHHLMTICKTGQTILPRLKTNIPEIDGRDAALFDLIAIDASQWNAARTEWPEISGME
jgi:hypothetical protein